MVWKINFKDIYIEGISRITPLGHSVSRISFGYKIKLLAIGKKKKTVKWKSRGPIPPMIPKDNLLSNVDGTLNAITITGDAVGGHCRKWPWSRHDADEQCGGGRYCRTSHENMVLGQWPAGYRCYLTSRTKLKRYRCCPWMILKLDIILGFRHLISRACLQILRGFSGRYGISLRSVHQKRAHSRRSRADCLCLRICPREKDAKAGAHGN